MSSRNSIHISIIAAEWNEEDGEGRICRECRVKRRCDSIVIVCEFQLRLFCLCLLLCSTSTCRRRIHGAKLPVSYTYESIGYIKLLCVQCTNTSLSLTRTHVPQHTNVITIIMKQKRRRRRRRQTETEIYTRTAYSCTHYSYSFGRRRRRRRRMCCFFLFFLSICCFVSTSCTIMTSERSQCTIRSFLFGVFVQTMKLTKGTGDMREYLGSIRWCVCVCVYVHCTTLKSVAAIVETKI